MNTDSRYIILVNGKNQYAYTGDIKGIHGNLKAVTVPLYKWENNKKPKFYKSKSHAEKSAKYITNMCENVVFTTIKEISK